MRRWYHISNKKTNSIAKFCREHQCKVKVEDKIVVDEDIIPISFSITMMETSTGSWIKVKCEKCGVKEIVSDEERIID